MGNRSAEGKYFIAYQGNEINHDSIKKALLNECPQYYTVKIQNNNNTIFAKIIYDSYVNDRDPYINKDILTVSSYDNDELEELNKRMKFNIDDKDVYHLGINLLYQKYSTNMFNKLKDIMDYIHVCTVIYDRDNDTLIAGAIDNTLIANTVNQNDKYTHLYYGYTEKNNEIMYSNSIDILKQFVKDVKELEKDTYIKDGEIYTFDEKKKDEKPEFIKNTDENSNNFISALNQLLIQITDESVRAKIENNIEEYLNSDDPKKKISDYILNELSNETQKQILKIIKKVIEEYQTENEITNLLYELFDKKIEEYTKNITVPITHVIKLNDTVLGQTQGGFYHEKFEQILTQVQLDEPIMLIGPAGSGKNVAIKQVADALGMHMYYTNNASNEFKLTGFIDAGGNYRDTEFYKAFKNGGIFFLDEIDNSDPSALIVINSALANGYMAFPHETIDRHKDFRIIAAANTWGKGADLQYVGRNALDGATLDRFDNIFFDYDEKLEENLYPNEDVLDFMWAFRKAVYETNIPHIVSTRGIGKVYKKEINNIPVENTLRSNVIKNLNQDDVNTIIGNMNNIDSYNKYYDGIKKLRLSR